MAWFFWRYVRCNTDDERKFHSLNHKQIIVQAILISKAISDREQIANIVEIRSGIELEEYTGISNVHSSQLQLELPFEF